MRLAPWADVVYGCDGPWWRLKNGLPNFKGIKLAHDTNVCADFRDINKIEINPKHSILVDEPGVVGSGGNSGFQALNLAVQFGANRILLIGYDMHGANGVHWYGPNVGKNMNNPRDSNFTRWRDNFAKQAGLLDSMGISVVNSSMDSALTCFEQKTIEQTLSDWGL